MKGQTMIQTLARKRTNAVALAVIAALIAAMFVAFIPARADHAPDALGDVNFNTAQCNAGVLQGDGDDSGTFDDQVQVYVRDATPTDTSNADTIAITEGDQPGFANLTSDLCKAEDTSTTPTTPAVNNDVFFSITPNGTETPIITKLNPNASIRVGDSDGVVKAGVDVVATISLKTIEPAAAGAVTIAWVRVSGELDNPTKDGDGTDFPATHVFANAGSKTPAGLSTTALIEIPEGTTEKEYTVSARLEYNHDGDDGTTPVKVLTPSAKFIVGDPGINAASASLTLGNAHDEDPLTSANDVVAEDGTEPANGGDVWLRLSVSNSRGEKANAAGLNTITVIAPGATLSLHPSTAAGTPGDAIDSATQLSGGSNSISVNEGGTGGAAVTVGQTTFIKVSRAGSPPKPGTVTVYALVIGTDGAPRSEDVDVIFTGSAASVVLGDGVSVGQPGEGAQAQAEISLSAVDAGGSDATFGTVVYSVTDADGDPVSQSKVKAETSTKGSSTEKDTDNNPNVKVVLITVDDSASPGVYTVEASLSGVDDSEDTATVTVSGIAANVVLSSSSMTSDTIGDVITVTAMVTDADGNAISDGQLVTFDVSGEGLVQIGSDASTGADGMAGFQSKTKGGSASALFTVTGEGTAVVSAVIGSQTAVAVIVSTAGSAAAPQDVTLDCLSSLTGFSSYTCSMGSTASELFGMLSGRGATAIHLWNGSMWVRYAVVDGAEIPGSSDFTVAEDDILYISN